MPVKTTGGPSDSNYHVKVNTTQHRQVASHLPGSTELSSGSMHHPSPTQHHIPQLHSIHTGLRWAYGIKWHYVHCTKDRTPISHVIAYIFQGLAKCGHVCGVWGINNKEMPTPWFQVDLDQNAYLPMLVIVTMWNVPLYVRTYTP